MGEGVGAIWLPWHLMKMIVRSRLDVYGRKAELALAVFLPMDLGRYADIAINVCMIPVISFMPMRYYFPTLLAFFFSHIYIYMYDKCRMLRHSTGFNYSQYCVERKTEYLMSIPTGLMLGVFVFWYECKDFECPDGKFPYVDCFAALVSHILVHCGIVKLIMVFVDVKRYRPRTHYAACSRRTPCNWFSANPIHCLRSADIHGRRPACSYYIRGREHFIQEDVAYGQYFSMLNKGVNNFDTE